MGKRSRTEQGKTYIVIHTTKDSADPSDNSEARITPQI